MSASALRVTYSGPQSLELDRALDILATRFGYKVRGRDYDWVVGQQHICYGQITDRVRDIAYEQLPTHDTADTDNPS